MSGNACHVWPLLNPLISSFLGGRMHLLWWIIVGLIAGWATGKIMSGRGYGPLMDIVLGIVGAIIGGFIMRALGFSDQGGMIYTILVAFGGAVLLTWLYRLVTRRRSDDVSPIRKGKDDDRNLRRVA